MTNLENLLADQLRHIKVNLAALLPDPKNPDFSEALKAGNPADNRELCEAYEACSEALADFEEQRDLEKNRINY